MSSTLADPQDYLAALREWLRDECAGLKPFRSLDAFTVEDRVEALAPLHRTLYDAGWSRWGWPEACGGLGGSPLHRGILYEELACAGIAIPHGLMLIETLGPMVISYAPHLAEQFIPNLLAGDESWSQGFSEPDAGSDLAGLRCRAVQSGSDYVINGEKVWASWGHLATRCLLLARTGTPDSRHRGLSFFLVDHGSDGMAARPIAAASGRNDFAGISFEGVHVAADRMVGVPGEGWAAAMYLLQWERGMYAWQRQAVLHHEVGAAVQRVADAGVAVPGPVAARLGEVQRQLHGLRLASRRTLRVLSERRNPGPIISVDKLLLSAAEHSAHDVIRELVTPDLEFADHSGAAVLRAEHYYSRMASVYGGSAEVQHSILADQVLKLPREGRS